MISRPRSAVTRSPAVATPADNIAAKPSRKRFIVQPDSRWQPLARPHDDAERCRYIPCMYILGSYTVKREAVSDTTIAGVARILGGARPLAGGGIARSAGTRRS